MDTLHYPASPQTDLWSRLTTRQQAETAALFRHMKKASQVEMCDILCDYIDHAFVPVFPEEELLLAVCFTFLTGHGMEEKAPWRIQPIVHN